MLAAVLYILVTLLANYTAELFIPFFGGLLSVGTFFFGATFTLRDYTHRNGRPFVYMMIAAALVCNVAMSILLDVPWRIILASFLAIALAETADTEVYHRFLDRTWYARVIRSNAISIPLDTTLFTCIAFLGVFPFTQIVQIIFGDILFKAVIASMFMFAHHIPLVNRVLRPA